MLEHMTRRFRSLLCLFLTSLALALSVLAFCTSYWCEGTHKVVKPLCLSPVKMEKCGQNNSQPSTTGKVPSESPTPGSPATSNTTLLTKRREGVAKIQQRQLANAVQYIWETGEDKYMFRYFHTGFWESCEKHADGERCRRFFDLTPGETHGVLWLSMISEFTYISLLGIGFVLMWLEILCSHKEMHALKINACAALCTVLSGLIGMVAHMMYSTVFQLTVIVGPKDWRPQNWDYGWSFMLAWVSFSCCMGAAVLNLNSYTKTLIELHRRQKLQLKETPAVPSYEEVLSGEGVHSISGLIQCSDKMIVSMWVEHENVGINGVRNEPKLVLIGGCRPQECEDCERERDEMEETMKRENRLAMLKTRCVTFS